jgi:hypothetical protein
MFGILVLPRGVARANAYLARGDKNHFLGVESLLQFDPAFLQILDLFLAATI